MGKIHTLIMLIKERPNAVMEAVMENLAKSPISHCIPDSLFIKMRYKAIFRKSLRLKNPVTFNEKLQYLKLYNRNPEHIRFVDKQEAKNYVSERLGKEYIIPTLGIWQSFEDINFDELPSQFVLKCTHDSGSTVICKNKRTFDVEAAQKKLSRKLGINLFWHGREWPYKNLKPRIIAEQYLDDNGEAPKDYKFFCFNGKVKCFKIDFDRFTQHKANYYAPDKTLMRFGEVVCPPDFNRELDIPENIDQMMQLAEKLSGGFPFLRVDFYNVNGCIYFGEMTFFPASGFGPFIPETWDETLGSWIELPERTK